MIRSDVLSFVSLSFVRSERVLAAYEQVYCFLSFCFSVCMESKAM